MTQPTSPPSRPIPIAMLPSHNSDHSDWNLSSTPTQNDGLHIPNWRNHGRTKPFFEKNTNYISNKNHLLVCHSIILTLIFASLLPFLPRIISLTKALELYSCRRSFRPRRARHRSSRSSRLSLRGLLRWMKIAYELHMDYTSVLSMDIVWYLWISNLYPLAIKTWLAGKSSINRGFELGK